MEKCTHCTSEMPNLDISALQIFLPTTLPVLVCRYAGAGPTAEATLRLECATEEQLLSWLEDFQLFSKITLRKAQTFVTTGRLVLFKCKYRCQHNTRQKNEQKNMKSSSKNTKCPFELTAAIRRSDVKQRKNAKLIHHLQHPTTINVKLYHNHSLHSTDTLRKRDVGPEVALKFKHLFEAGLSPSSALKVHKYDLQMEDSSDCVIKLSDRYFCPDLPWCYRLYYKHIRAQNCSIMETAANDLDSIVSEIKSNASSVEEDVTSDNAITDTETWPQPSTASLHEITKAEVSQTVDEVLSKAMTICESLRSDPETFLAPVKDFLRNFDQLSTNSAMVSALRSFGKCSGVTSTCVAGRKRLALANKRVKGQPTSKSQCITPRLGRCLAGLGQPSTKIDTSDHNYGRDTQMSSTTAVSWVTQAAQIAAPHNLSACMADNIHVFGK